MTTTQAEQLADSARRVADLARTVTDEIEEGRRLPEQLVSEMSEARLFGLFFPAAAGGPEADPVSAMRAMLEVSQADGSAGWLAMVQTSLSLNFGWVQPDVARAMAPDGQMRLCGSGRPLGRAKPVEGGYLVSGRWDFMSGVHHATWVMGTCVVMDGDCPRLDEAGQPVTRGMLFPVTAGRVIDTWHVIGMRGTGSCDYEVEDEFVPASHSVHRDDPPAVDGPLYQVKFFSAWSHVVNAGNSLGIARAAIDELRRVASDRASTGSPTVLLRDRTRVQAKVGEAEAIWRSAYAYVTAAAEAAWEAAQHADRDAPTVVADLRLAIAHAGFESVRVVNLMFHAAGTNAIYTKHRLERHLRDIHVSVEHGASNPEHYETAGRVFLGLPPGRRGW